MEGNNSKKIESDATELPDRISALPDSVLLHILSMMPFQYVMQTSCLSTRWQHLWQSVPTLDFSKMEVPATTLIEVVDKVLEHRDGSRINKFKICAGCNLLPAEQVDLWIKYVSGQVLEDLVLDCTPCELDEEVNDEGYNMRQCVLECKSLKDLTLKFCRVNLPPSVYLPFLKKLHIDFTELEEEVLKTLLAGCPMLKDMTLKHCNRSRDLVIVAPTSNLEKLNIYEFYDDQDSKLEIFAPNLLSLTLSGEPKRSVYCGKDLSSIVFVNLSFGTSICPKWEFDGIPCGEIIDDFCCAKSLELGIWCTLGVTIRAIEGLGDHRSYSITTLAIESRFKKCELPGLAWMLRNFVNLRLLIIDVVEGYLTDYDEYLEANNYDEETYWNPDEISFSGRLKKLKYVEIYGLTGSIPITEQDHFKDPEAFLRERETEFDFVKFLLRKLKALEYMTVAPVKNLKKLPKGSVIMSKIASKLMGFPKSARNARVLLEDE